MVHSVDQYTNPKIKRKKDVNVITAMERSLGYIKWEKKARCNVFIMLGYRVNRMGAYMSEHTQTYMHIHTLICSITHCST